MSATKELLIGTVSSLLATLIVGVSGVVGVKFTLPSMHLNVPLIEVPPRSPRLLPMLKRLMGRGLLFAIFIALGTSSIDMELELSHGVQIAGASSSAISSQHAAYSPDFYFSKANSALTHADLEANTRSLMTQSKISSLLLNERMQSHLALKDQQEQIKNITQEQIKQLLERDAAQSASELSEAKKEAEFWRAKAAGTMQATQPAPPPKQPWYESALTSVSETMIWGILLFGYLAYILQINRKSRPSISSVLAALLIIVTMSAMSILGMNSTALLTIEALLLSGVIYAGSERALRVPEMLINAPYLVYQRLFLAVGLIAFAALATSGLLGAATGVGMTSLFKHLASSDDSVTEAWVAALPFLGIPVAFVFDFIANFFVAFAGAIYLTSLIYVDDTAISPPKADFERQPESFAAKAN